MKFTKPLTAAAVTGALLLGGVGIAGASDDGDNDIVDGEATALQVQLEEDGTENDTTEDGERNGRRGNRRGNRLATVAEVLGLEADELRAELQDGATIADVAEANGVEVDEVVDALVANVTERLDARVEDGSITEEEAAERLESKTERIENKVNGIDNDTDEDTDEDTNEDEVDA